jgi:hypothetical protein
MDKPEFFEHTDGYARYAPIGDESLSQTISLVSAAITYARLNKITKLLINVTKLTGFGPPTTMERFTLGGQFARAAQGAVKVAMLCKAEMIDPEKFGVTVAVNRGLVVEVFATEKEALAWLLG